jgi:hypothetical protein
MNGAYAMQKRNAYIDGMPGVFYGCAVLHGKPIKSPKQTKPKRELQTSPSPNRKRLALHDCITSP